MDDVFVYIIGMDTMVHEQVVANSDGSYSVFINDCLSPEQRLKAYNHALQHIKNGDFGSADGVDSIERKAHG
jgi:TolA-binding protein